jgi:transposase
MKRLLEKMNDAVNQVGGRLPHKEAEQWKVQYRELLGKAEIECPLPDKPVEKRRGRIKRSKARNLLERLINYEEDVLRFMTQTCVPSLFTACC